MITKLVDGKYVSDYGTEEDPSKWYVKYGYHWCDDTCKETLYTLWRCLCCDCKIMHIGTCKPEHQCRYPHGNAYGYVTSDHTKSLGYHQYPYIQNSKLEMVGQITIKPCKIGEGDVLYG